MKKFLLIICICSVSLANAQVDSLQLKKIENESRFKVAGRVLKNNLFSVPGDFSEMGKTFSKDWKRTAMYAGGILGLIAVDKYTTDFLHNHIEPAIDYSLPKTKVFNSNFDWFKGNDLYISASIASLYAGSFAFNYEKGQMAATNAVKSLLYSYVISHVALKTLFARNRPYREGSDQDPSEWTDNNWDFGNYHPIYFNSKPGGTGMPSFHATAFFSVAKVMQMEFDNYWIPYGFISIVFMSDFPSHQHWVSDMVVGGIIGTIIGRSVVLSSRKQKAKENKGLSQHSKKKFKLRKQLIPQVSENMVGLHFVGTF
ncbi:phosphatase PAP2 family protein [Flavicella sediminum]|uniref:phosphatase PAP2 family protein n=1 Tax=Flavicella sediminum TaxID=2585141 RepID=UPI00111F18BB|nr:phosphatase PAP2 family protein [Flavicella sediminum]